MDPAIVRENINFIHEETGHCFITLKTGVKISIKDHYSFKFYLDFIEDAKGNELTSLPEGYRLLDSRNKVANSFLDDGCYYLFYSENYRLLDANGDVLLDLKSMKGYNISAPGCLDSSIEDN